MLREISSNLDKLSQYNIILPKEILILLKSEIPSYCSKCLRNNVVNIETTKTSPTRRRYQIDAVNQTIPYPSLGNQYTPIEAMTVLASETKTPVSMNISLMLDNEYVLIKRSTLYTMFRKYKITSVCSEECHIAGRILVITVNTLNIEIDKHFLNYGLALMVHSINSILTKARNQRTMHNELSCYSIRPISPYVLQCYKCLTVSHPSRAIRNKAQ